MLRVTLQFTAKEPKVDVSAHFDAGTDEPIEALKQASQSARETVKIWRVLRGVELTFRASIED